MGTLATNKDHCTTFHHKSGKRLGSWLDDTNDQATKEKAFTSEYYSHLFGGLW